MLQHESDRLHSTTFHVTIADRCEKVADCDSTFTKGWEVYAAYVFVLVEPEMVLKGYGPTAPYGSTGPLLCLFGLADWVEQLQPKLPCKAVVQSFLGCLPEGEHTAQIKLLAQSQKVEAGLHACLQMIPERFLPLLKTQKMLKGPARWKKPSFPGQRTREEAEEEKHSS